MVPVSPPFKVTTIVISVGFGYYTIDYGGGPTSVMSKQVTVTLDDEDFEYATEMKEFLGLTWEEFMIEAAECFDEQIANGRVA